MCSCFWYVPVVCNQATTVVDTYAKIVLFSNDGLTDMDCGGAFAEGHQHPIANGNMCSAAGAAF